MEDNGDGLPLLRGEIVHRCAGGLPLGRLLLGGDDLSLLPDHLACWNTHRPVGSVLSSVSTNTSSLPSPTPTLQCANTWKYDLSECSALFVSPQDPISRLHSRLHTQNYGPARIPPRGGGRLGDCTHSGQPSLYPVSDSTHPRNLQQPQSGPATSNLAVSAPPHPPAPASPRYLDNYNIRFYEHPVSHQIWILGRESSLDRIWPQGTYNLQLQLDICLVLSWSPVH